MGVQYRIANIKIDNEIKENTDDLTEADVFYYPEEEDGGGTTSIGIRNIELEIGFLNYDGSYDTDFLGIDIGGLISVPNSEGGGVKSWQTTIPTDSDSIGPPNPPFEVLSANKNIFNRDSESSFSGEKIIIKQPEGLIPYSIQKKIFIPIEKVMRTEKFEQIKII